MLLDGTQTSMIYSFTYKGVAYSEELSTDSVLLVNYVGMLAVACSIGSGFIAICLVLAIL